MDDLIGKRFGRWTVKSCAGTNRHRQSIWLCVCGCPKKNERIVSNGALKNGKSKSCGCWFKETRKTSAATHGGCYEPEYDCWRGMNKRCYDKRHKSYALYGALGVKVQEEWHRQYRPFKDYLLRTIGPRPSKDHTVDRFPNKAGNYEEGNIRWATRVEQQRNMKSNVYLTFNDERRTMAEWTEIKGWHRSKIKNRRRSGWSDERILGTP